MARTRIRGNTQIMEGSILNAQIAADAAIATSKLADGADFLKRDGSVALTANIPAGGFTLTGLGTPVGDNDAARKIDVERATMGLNVKNAARASTTANIDLVNTGSGDTVDGVVLSNGDRLLVKNQTDATENGIYLVQGSGGPLVRASDADTSDKFPTNTFLFVSEGTVNADTGWVSINDGDFELGTDDLIFTQFSGAGSGTVNGATNVGSAGVSVFKQLSDDILEFHKLNSTNGSLTIELVEVEDRIDFTINEGSIDHDSLMNYDINQHRTINDSASGSTDLWSAAKITSELADKVSVAGYSEAELLVADSSGDLTPVTISGDATLSSAGVLTLGSTVVKTTSFVFNETPSGVVDGVNTEFVLADEPVSGTVQVFYDGVKMDEGVGNDYTISGDTITLEFAPLSGDKIRVNYIK